MAARRSGVVGRWHCRCSCSIPNEPLNVEADDVVGNGPVGGGRKLGGGGKRPGRRTRTEGKPQTGAESRRLNLVEEVRRSGGQEARAALCLYPGVQRGRAVVVVDWEIPRFETSAALTGSGRQAWLATAGGVSRVHLRSPWRGRDLVPRVAWSPTGASSLQINGWPAAGNLGRGV